jgi:glycosyltransferase involved in cell wall biosynthesis
MSYNRSDTKPRVCLLTEVFYPVVGGSITHARLLSEKLIESGVDLFVLTRRVTSDLKEYEMIGKIPVYRVKPSGFKRLGKYLMTIPAFWNLLRKRNEYNVIYVCGIRILGLVAVLISVLLGKRCVLRLEISGEMSGDYIKHEISEERKLFLKFVQVILALRNEVLKKSDSFISISKAIEDELLQCCVDPSKIKYIPNGIDIIRFSPVDENTKSLLRKKLNIPPKKLVFLYTGRLTKIKGLELLLRVWKRLIQEEKDLHLILVGPGENQFLSCEYELKQFVNKHNLDSVTFTGAVENVCEYLQCSDCFVLPSKSEGLPISLLEAMSCGLPCIATSVGGIPDLIEYGKNGKLVKVGDEEGIYNAIVELIRNMELARIMGEKGRKTLVERFSIDSIAGEHIKLFVSLLNAGGKGKDPF